MNSVPVDRVSPKIEVIYCDVENNTQNTKKSDTKQNSAKKSNSNRSRGKRAKIDKAPKMQIDLGSQLEKLDDINDNASIKDEVQEDDIFSLRSGEKTKPERKYTEYVGLRRSLRNQHLMKEVIDSTPVLPADSGSHSGQSGLLSECDGFVDKKDNEESEDNIIGVCAGKKMKSKRKSTGNIESKSSLRSHVVMNKVVASVPQRPTESESDSHPDKLEEMHEYDGIKDVDREGNRTSAPGWRIHYRQKQKTAEVDRIGRENLNEDGTITKEGIAQLEIMFPEMKTIGWRDCKYKCEKCEAVIIGSEQFFSHFKCLHYNDPYQIVCYYCGEIHQKIYLLNNHIEQKHYHHLKYACLYCPEFFWDFRKLRNHCSSHPPHEVTCILCMKHLNSKTSLLPHIRNFHLKPEESAEAKCICDICNLELPNKERIKYHMLTHSSS